MSSVSPGNRTSGRSAASSPGDESGGRVVAVLGIAPHVRQPVAARELDDRARLRGRARSDHLHADPLDPLERLPPRDEGREQEVAQRPVLEQERSQRLPLDRDVSHRLGRHGAEIDRLARQQVHLAEEAEPAVPRDLVAGGIEDRRLSLEDGDERIAPVADAEQALAGRRGSLLADLRELLQLRGGENGPGGDSRHRSRVAAPVRSTRSATPSIS